MKSYTPWTGKIDPTKCGHFGPVTFKGQTYCAMCGQLWAACALLKGWQALQQFCNQVRKEAR